MYKAQRQPGIHPCNLPQTLGELWQLWNSPHRHNSHNLNGTLEVAFCHKVDSGKVVR